MDCLDKIYEAPVIGAVHTTDPIEELIQSACKVYFILGGELLALKQMIQALKAADKSVFVDIDLIGGLKSDPSGLQFIYETMAPDGIITTKGQIIKNAKALGLCAIQRLFLLDSKNLQSGLASVEKYQPDAIEVLPGVIHKVTAQIVKASNIPVITGGLVQDKEDVIQCLKAGAIGVSTSKHLLWAI